MCGAETLAEHRVEACAGFTVRALETDCSPKEPTPLGYLDEGVAVA